MRRALPILFVLVVGACSPSNEDASTTTERPVATDGNGTEPPAAITCGAQHRPVGGSAAGESEESVSVERPSPGAPSEAANLSFADFELSVTYFDDGYETPSVLVTVSTPSGAEIERVLYQFGSSLSALSGGHGFTGLHYVYSGTAELQWWCTAESS